MKYHSSDQSLLPSQDFAGSGIRSPAVEESINEGIERTSTGHGLLCQRARLPAGLLGRPLRQITDIKKATGSQRGVLV